MSYTPEELRKGIVATCTKMESINALGFILIEILEELKISNELKKEANK